MLLVTPRKFAVNAILVENKDESKSLLGDVSIRNMSCCVDRAGAVCVDCEAGAVSPGISG
jgi:hypothetical protein